MPESKSLYRSRTRSHIYGTEYEILADFGLVGNTEKQIWDATYEGVFYVFMGKIIIKNIVASALKVYIKLLEFISLFF